MDLLFLAGFVSETWLAKLPESKFDAEQAVGPYGPGERHGSLQGAYAETYSWEGHGRGGSAAQPRSGEAYHAIGFRCMKVL